MTIAIGRTALLIPSLTRRLRLTTFHHHSHTMSSAHPSTAISKQSLLALRQYWFEGMEGPSPDQKQVEATMEKWFGGAKAVDEWCRNECGDMLKQADGETVEQLKEYAVTSSSPRLHSSSNYPPFTDTRAATRKTQCRSSSSSTRCRGMYFGA